MVDSRSISLASVCRALEQQRMMANALTLATQDQAMQQPQQLQHRHHHKHPQHSRSKDHVSNSHSSSPPLCDQSPAAAVDIVILLLVLGACGFLLTPYFRYVAHEAAEILPVTFMIIGEVVYQAPIAYASGAIFMFVTVIGLWEFFQYKARRCDSPHCKGLRKAMELDIELQTEQCVKAGPHVGAEELPWGDGAEIGEDQKELEAKLRRMAPPNGRAILIFRAPCGCPTVRFEAWGSKKGRRSKK